MRRTVDDTSPVTSAEPHLALTVYALRDRRLVTLQRSNGQWTAQATDDGRYFATH